jgi:hypothetical protein
MTSCEICGTGTGFAVSLFGLALLIIILPLPHTRVSLPYEVCDSPEQAAHYHTLSL